MGRLVSFRMSAAMAHQFATTAVDLPLGIGINKTLFLGPLPARFAAEVSYYAVSSGEGPSPEWGFRFSVTPVIPAFILRGGG